MTTQTGGRSWVIALLVCFGLIYVEASSRIATADDTTKQTQSEKASNKKAVPNDYRLQPLKTLDGYFPFTPYKSQEEWNKRAEQLKRQLLVATGLWPMPERAPPQAIVHGKVDRDEYTVEKVILESWPGHYVTGNLYRPKGRTGKLAAVLCPHGHWNNGRFYDAGEAGVKKQIEQGAEKFNPSGRYPLQARCVQLARMGCVVFHYDMLGYADSVQIPASVSHRYSERRPHMEGDNDWGFFSPQAELHMQSILGLQTYNSIRALDWLCELPDVDSGRIGVTGASGGGTQTFILCAIDPRPAVAFPAVMVSTAMQGGCTCENCSYLRIGTGNIEIAALIGPRPLGMTAADDWTKEMETKGFPELKQHYKMLGVPDNVMLAALLKFEHNYNYPSRAAMYEWMNKHLRLGQPSPIVEKDFKPLTIEEMSVWTGEHPKPAGDNIGDAYERKLLRQMTEEAQRQLAALRPDPKRPESLKEYERVVGGAWDTLIGRQLPSKGSVQFASLERQDKGVYTLEQGRINYAAQREQVPAVILSPKQSKNATAIWLDEAGKSSLFETSGEPRKHIQKLLDAGVTVVGVDLLNQGDSLADRETEPQTAIKHPRNFAGFTYGYNYPLFAKRVHDVLSTIAAVRDRQADDKIHLIGGDVASAWAMAAVNQAPNFIHTLIVGDRFRFSDLKSIDDPHLLPGAVKYGDVDGLWRTAKRRVKLYHIGNALFSARRDSAEYGVQEVDLLLKQDAPQ